MDVIVLSSNMAQDLGSRNLIHHQKYNQVMEPQQLIVQIAKIRILNGGPNVAVQALDLLQWKQITVLGRLFNFPI
jgi:hypothetical protein